MLFFFFLLGLYAQANSHIMDNTCIAIYMSLLRFLYLPVGRYEVVWYLYVCPMVLHMYREAACTIHRTRHNRQTLIDEIPLKLAIYNEMLYGGKGKQKKY